MIELPRAALRAGDLAEAAEFFSFGTNDLTQTTFGISRDDSGRFLDAYIRRGIFEKDPFVTLDREGVGELIRIAAERGRATRPDIKLGICGEHGGDPASIAFCAGAWAWITCPARPTACPSPGWPRRRRRWRTKPCLSHGERKRTAQHGKVGIPRGDENLSLPLSDRKGLPRQRASPHTLPSPHRGGAGLCWNLGEIPRSKILSGDRPSAYSKRPAAISCAATRPWPPSRPPPRPVSGHART